MVASLPPRGFSAVTPATDAPSADGGTSPQERLAGTASWILRGAGSLSAPMSPTNSSRLFPEIRGLERRSSPIIVVP